MQPIYCSRLNLPSPAGSLDTTLPSARAFHLVVPTVFPPTRLCAHVHAQEDVDKDEVVLGVSMDTSVHGPNLNRSVVSCGDSRSASQPSLHQRIPTHTLDLCRLL